MFLVLRRVDIGDSAQPSDACRGGNFPPSSRVAVFPPDAPSGSGPRAAVRATFLRSACGSHAARDWVIVTLHLALALAVARLVRYELSA